MNDKKSSTDPLSRFLADGLDPFAQTESTTVSKVHKLKPFSLEELQQTIQDPIYSEASNKTVFPKLATPHAPLTHVHHIEPVPVAESAPTAPQSPYGTGPVAFDPLLPTDPALNALSTQTHMPAVQGRETAPTYVPNGHSLLDDIYFSQEDLLSVEDNGVEQPLYAPTLPTQAYRTEQVAPSSTVMYPTHPSLSTAPPTDVSTDSSYFSYRQTRPIREDLSLPRQAHTTYEALDDARLDMSWESSPSLPAALDTQTSTSSAFIHQGISLLASYERIVLAPPNMKQNPSREVDLCASTQRMLQAQTHPTQPPTFDRKQPSSPSVPTQRTQKSPHTNPHKRMPSLQFIQPKKVSLWGRVAAFFSRFF